MNHDEFMTEAKAQVVAHTKEHVAHEHAASIEPDDVYVVWSCKTLQNSKALLGTPLSDGMYYEATLNGDKQEMYFDAYKKQENKCITFV